MRNYCLIASGGGCLTLTVNRESAAKAQYLPAWPVLAQVALPSSSG
jgi:hypothetical protein